MNVSSEPGHEIPQHALGESPYRVVLMAKNVDLARTDVPDVDHAAPTAGSYAKSRHRNPECISGLWIGHDGHIRRDDGDKGPDDERRQHGRPRGKVVEAAEHVSVARDVHARF